MSSDKLSSNLQKWQDKPVLKIIYHDFYERISAFLVQGKTLEIGGGTGNLKEYAPNVIASDIIDSPWLDCVLDAQSIPLANESIETIVGVDVLHHIERPVRFFREALRVLKPGGRVILLDPAITPLSYFFYHFIHEEPVVMSINPLEDGELDANRQPFDANQAIPSLIFNKYFKNFKVEFPDFQLVSKRYISILAYPLSGGFQKWSLMPTFLTLPLLKAEKFLEPAIGKMLGFRILVTLEKSR